MNEISQRARELLAAEIEAVAGFHETRLLHDAADLRKGRHLASLGKHVSAALRAIEKALSPLPSGDDLVERVARALFEFERDRPNGGRRRPAWENELPEFRDYMRDKARTAIASIGRDEVIEECAKVAESLHAWHGSADLINGLDRRRFAYAIRALKSQGGEKRK